MEPVVALISGATNLRKPQDTASFGLTGDRTLILKRS